MVFCMPVFHSVFSSWYLSKSLSSVGLAGLSRRNFVYFRESHVRSSFLMSVIVQEMSYFLLLSSSSRIALASVLTWFTNAFICRCFKAIAAALDLIAEYSLGT